MIKLFIFDLDGVLASTSDEHFTAWKEVIKDRFNIDVEDYVEEFTKGVSRMDSLNKILDTYDIKVSEKEKEELAFIKNEKYKEYISKFNETNLFSGVKELFQFLKNNNILIALGSASKNGPALLKSMGIEEYFDFVVDPGPLNSKPHPDIFITAMNHFLLNPGECVGIEDAISGVKAIKSAHMLAIGIGDKDVLTEADFIYDSIQNIKFSFLEALIKDKYEKAD
jgi:beta-phosphoglucomutase